MFNISRLWFFKTIQRQNDENQTRVGKRIYDIFICGKLALAGMGIIGSQISIGRNIFGGRKCLGLMVVAGMSRMDIKVGKSGRKQTCNKDNRQYRLPTSFRFSVRGHLNSDTS